MCRKFWLWGLVVTVIACFNQPGTKMEAKAQPDQSDPTSLEPFQNDTDSAKRRHLFDYENAFSNYEERNLDSILITFQQQFNLYVAVVAFDSVSAPRDSIEQVTRSFAMRYGTNITVGIFKLQRKMYIWNDSFANSNLLREWETSKIIKEHFIPSFRKGKFYEGTSNGLAAIKVNIERSMIAPKVKW